MPAEPHSPWYVCYLLCWNLFAVWSTSTSKAICWKDGLLHHWSDWLGRSFPKCPIQCIEWDAKLYWNYLTIYFLPNLHLPTYVPYAVAILFFLSSSYFWRHWTWSREFHCFYFKTCNVTFDPFVTHFVLLPCPCHSLSSLWPYLSNRSMDKTTRPTTIIACTQCTIKALYRLSSKLQKFFRHVSILIAKNRSPDTEIPQYSCFFPLAYT